VPVIPVRRMLRDHVKELWDDDAKVYADTDAKFFIDTDTESDTPMLPILKIADTCRYR